MIETHPEHAAAADRRGGGPLRLVVAAGGARLVVLPVAAVLSLLTARVIIVGTGSVGYGLVSLIVSLFAILPFGDLGLGAGVVNVVAQSDDPRRDPAVLRRIAGSLQLLTSLAAALAAIAVVLAVLGAWAPILGGPHELNRAAGWALALLGLGMPLALGQRVLLGLHRAGLATVVQLVGSVVTTVIVVVAWRAHAGLTVYAAAFPLGTVVGSVAQWVAAARAGGPSLRLIASTVIFERLHRSSLWASGLPMLVVTLGLPVALQTDRIVLAHRSSGSLAAYSLGLQFYAPVWGLIASAGLALWPVFSRRRRDEGAHTAGLSTAVGGFAAAGVAAATALVVGSLLLDGVVSDGRIRLGPALMVSFGVLLVVQAVQLPLGMFFTDVPGLRFQARCVAAMAVVSLVVSILLAPTLRGPGVLLGSLVAILTCQVVPGILRARRVGASSRSRA